jgi:hypothetical protein
MNAHTANSLLKILEEPPAGVHFLMTTERVSSVLPTITSRASVVRFRRLKEKEISAFLEESCGLEPKDSEAYASMAEGSIKTAKALAFEQKTVTRSRAFDLYKSVALGSPDDVIGQGYSFIRSRDVHEAEELIGGFALCTRGVLEKVYGLPCRDQAFSDSASALAAATGMQALHELSAKLEEGMEMLGRNVNISTVMTSLFYGIHDAYK